MPAKKQETAATARKAAPKKEAAVKAAPKKAAPAAKAAPKKTAPKKASAVAPKKAAPKKTTAAAPKKTTAAAPKKAAPKKAAPKKPAVLKVDVAELLARRAAELTLEKKCEEVRILDVRELTTMTDFFVIATADSDRKAKAAAEHVLDELREEGERPHNIEGMETMRWVLLDYVDVVVHIFMPEDRRFYDLESLWSDAKVITVS